MTANPATDALRLVPCPFCGGEAEIVHIDEGENAGGSCVYCTKCQASSNVEFEFKENFVSNWNRRAAPASPLPEGGGDEALIAELKEARGLMKPFAAMADEEGGYRDDDRLAWGLNRCDITWGNLRAARAFLARNGEVK